MSRLRMMARGAYLSVALVLSAACLPFQAFAADPTCTPPPDPGPGIHHPVGADASAYTYNCDTSEWESAHFTYDPATGSVTANDPTIYTYNATTGQYDTTSWVWNAPQGAYQQITQSVKQPPTGARVIGAPSISNTGAGSNNNINENGGLNGGSSIDNTGANSNNNIDGSANNNDTTNNTTTATMNNKLGATATSGNALVLNNTIAGSATSGGAQNLANVVNMLQSTSNALSGNTTTFVANIDGDVNGDLLLDPSQLGTIQPAANQPLGNNNLTINNKVDATLNNDINLDSSSGDATVANNTHAGDATSGSAKAIANVVNLINSSISAGKSFVGVININGNLNGDILVPQNFIDQLVANNVPTVTIDTTGAGSNNNINQNNNSNNTNVKNTNNEGITNNVNATATSGSADVSGNTNAGNATSGNAKNSITAFNLTGSNIIGSNDLLVFVNVLGSWVGMIVNAPPGSTAAELAGGVSQNSQNGSNNTTNIDNNTNEKINNNITTKSKSGNASVKNNTNAGSATSGDAENAINLLNMENSNLSLSGWFGILFINVFGTWHGSFGVNTSAGDQFTAAAGNNSAAGGSGSFTPTVFSFVPTKTGGSGSFAIAPTASISNTGAGSNNSILAAKTEFKIHPNAPTPQLQNNGHSIKLTATIIGSLVIMYIAVDAYYTSRHNKNLAAK